MSFVKKMVLVLLLLCLSMAVFAQEAGGGEAAASSGSGGKKNAIAMDLFPLFKGFIAADYDQKISFFCLAMSYERLVVPHFSIGGDMDMYFGGLDSVGLFYFGLGAQARFYPLSQGLDKFFIGTGLGFNLLSIDGEKPRAEDFGFFGLTISLRAGYKLVLGNVVYFEPSMAYVLSKSSSISGFMSGVSIPTPLGWQGGLRFGFMF